MRIPSTGEPVRATQALAALSLGVAGARVGMSTPGGAPSSRRARLEPRLALSASHAPLPCRAAIITRLHPRGRLRESRRRPASQGFARRRWQGSAGEGGDQMARRRARRRSRSKELLSDGSTEALSRAIRRLDQRGCPDRSSRCRPLERSRRRLSRPGAAQRRSRGPPAGLWRRRPGCQSQRRSLAAGGAVPTGPWRCNASSLVPEGRPRPGRIGRKLDSRLGLGPRGGEPPGPELSGPGPQSTSEQVKGELARAAAAGDAPAVEAIVSQHSPGLPVRTQEW